MTEGPSQQTRELPVATCNPPAVPVSALVLPRRIHQDDVIASISTIKVTMLPEGQGRGRWGPWRMVQQSGQNGGQALHGGLNGGRQGDNIGHRDGGQKKGARFHNEQWLARPRCASLALLVSPPPPAFVRPASSLPP